MNVIDYLGMKVTPLSEYTPTPRSERIKPKEVKLREDNHKKRLDALVKYRNYMGDRWVATRELNEWLGWRSGACKVMKTWVGLGLIERRDGPRGGYEWKFRDENTD